MIPAFLVKWCEIETNIWKSTKDSLDKAVQLADDAKLKKLSQQLIIYISTYKPFSFVLLSEYFQKFGECSFKVKNSKFTAYLFHKGILKTSNFEAEPPEMEYPDEYFDNPFQGEPLQEAIFKDDVQKLAYNANSSIHNVPAFIGPYEFHRLIDMAAFCGSWCCFNYLELNGSRVNEQTIKYAIEGGSLDIIKRLETLNKDMNNHYYSAIKQHQNEIAEWLKESFTCEDVPVADLLYFRNTDQFIKEIVDGKDINEKGYNDMTALFFAVEDDNIELVKWMLQKGADTKATSYNNEKVIDFAKSDEMKSLLNK